MAHMVAAPSLTFGGTAGRSSVIWGVAACGALLSAFWFYLWARRNLDTSTSRMSNVALPTSTQLATKPKAPQTFDVHPRPAMRLGIGRA